ncbi:hypothetical protein GGR57DRAFT_105991 [Xylariaceae sp. FL1272]|nr:hypothetical protein GGR57DRAFT_105991 [Xylariaceae sp. FL1272]
MRTALDLGADVQGVGFGEEDPDWVLKVIDEDERARRERREERREYGSPLHYGAKHGNDDIVALLLERGAKLDAPSLSVCDCLEHRVFWQGRGRDTAASLVPFASRYMFWASLNGEPTPKPWSAVANVIPITERKVQSPWPDCFALRRSQRP